MQEAGEKPIPRERKRSKRMKFGEIQKMAKGMGIRTSRVGKTELIRAIQKQENNFPCYGTDRVGHCAELCCLWREDCLALNHGTDPRAP
jgi:hypothetical protein